MRKFELLEIIEKSENLLPSYKIFNSEESYNEALDSFLDENKPDTLEQLGCIDCVW